MSTTNVHNHLPSDGTYLDLDINDPQRFSADIDLDQARVDGFVELAEACDQADRACVWRGT